MGADEFFVSLLVGSYASASFISSYLSGRAGDIHGRRSVLRVGLLLSAVSFALLLFVDSPLTLYIVRLMNGFSIGIYPGALAAYAYDSHMRMGRFASFGAVGWGAGTVLAGFSALVFLDLRASFAVASLFFVIAFVSAMSLPPMDQPRLSVPLFPVATLKRNIAPYVAVLVRHSSASAVWTFWPLFLRSLGGDYLMISTIQCINSFAQVVFMAAITDRLDSRRLVSIGLVSSSVTFLSFTVATDILELLPTQVLLGFSWACLYVGALRFVVENNEERATSVGLLQSILSISSVIGPVIAAILFSVFQDYIPIMRFAAISSVASLVLFLALSRSSQAVSPKPHM